MSSSRSNSEDFWGYFAHIMFYGVFISIVVITGNDTSSTEHLPSQNQQPTKTTRFVTSYSTDNEYNNMRHEDRPRGGRWYLIDDRVEDTNPYEDYLTETAHESSAYATDAVRVATAEAERDATRGAAAAELFVHATEVMEAIFSELATDEAMFTRDALQYSSSHSGTAYATTNLNVRTGPGENCPVLSTIGQNSAITPIYCNSDCSWLLLSGSGWVSANYVANQPAELYIYTDIPACAYESSSPIVQQPVPTVSRPSCGGGCINPPSGCNIKGNVGYNSGERIYHVPGQAYYYDTVIDTRYGERWFCTEHEAQAAGWRRAYQ